MPIFPYATDFELFTPDPRPIQARLDGQTVWYDPKRAVSAWLEMEKRLGFDSHEGSGSDEEPTREISHVLAMGGGTASEEDSCHEAFIDGPYQSYPPAIWQETEESKKSLLSAAGFCVFPWGTFDTLDESLPGKAYQNLRAQRPGLGLFDLENDGGD
ncbi:unnamed protein product [Clonostachys byssicola]|uniref:Uncharacterized protein n=1 Tax=Clonostachys byssicola TaxID=160290 RepID=A0A9N9UUF9_9HYPO|nr:unnamed protein product [Clonostachys byssicola]